MDHESSSTVTEDGMRVVAPGDVLIFALEVGFAVGCDAEIGPVPCVMTFGILEAMLLAIGIEVWSCGFEIGRLALGILMEVDGMLSGRKVLNADFHANTWSGVPKNGGTNDLALRVLELNQDLGGTGGGQRDDEECEGEKAGGFHGGIITSFAGAGEDGQLRGFNLGEHEGGTLWQEWEAGASATHVVLIDELATSKTRWRSAMRTKCFIPRVTDDTYNVLAVRKNVSYIYIYMYKYGCTRRR